MSEVQPDYQHLLVTPDFERSLSAETADGSLEFSDEEFDGIMDALDILDAAPADTPGQIRLHAMKVELRPWWSITPPNPPGTGIRVMVRPEQRNGVGVGSSVMSRATTDSDRAHKPESGDLTT